MAIVAVLLAIRAARAQRVVEEVSRIVEQMWIVTYHTHPVTLGYICRHEEGRGEGRRERERERDR